MMSEIESYHCSETAGTIRHKLYEMEAPKEADSSDGVWFPRMATVRR